MIANIEKATGRVVDINQHYDERTHENMAVPEGVLPDNVAEARLYVKDVLGNLVKASDMPTSKRQALLDRIDEAMAGDPVEQLPELLAALREYLSSGT